MAEFTIERDFLAPALERLVAVCKNQRKGYEKFEQLSIKVEKDRLLLSTDNGFLKAVQEIKDEDKLAVIEEGECVVDANFMRNIVNSTHSDTRLQFK